MSASRLPGPVGNAIARLRAAVFFGLVSGSIFFCGLWLLPLAVFFKQPGPIKWAVRNWLRVVLPVFGLNLEVRGEEHLMVRKTVFVSNHQSWLDITIMMLRVRFPSFLAKKEIESWPFFGSTMRTMRCVFVDRSDRKSRNLVGQRVREQMEHGVDFCVFAEGTRSLDGGLQPFQGGAFRIAIEAKALVTPVVIDETWWMLNKKAFRLFPGLMRVRILPPIDTNLPENQDPKALLERVHSQMVDTLSQMRREPEASGRFGA